MADEGLHAPLAGSLGQLTRPKLADTLRGFDALHRIADDVMIMQKGKAWLCAIPRTIRFFLFQMPETRTFFSAPMQLARALVLRFPQHYAPETTDLQALAARLVREGPRFKAPPEVAAMVRTLWQDYIPIDVAIDHGSGAEMQQQQGEEEEEEDEETLEADEAEEEEEGGEEWAGERGGGAAALGAEEEEEGEADEGDEGDMVLDRGPLIGISQILEEEEWLAMQQQQPPPPPPRRFGLGS